MKKSLLLFLFLTVVVSIVYGHNKQKGDSVLKPIETSYIYRLTLKDKKGTPYELSKPEKFLSRKSILRRERQGLALDSTDLPVSPVYLKLLRNRHVAIVGTSKWNNTVLVLSKNEKDLEALATLPFVKKAQRVYKAKINFEMPSLRDNITGKFQTWNKSEKSFYGEGQKQLDMMDGKRLHDAGFRGENMTIAVLDAGFMNVDRIPAFKNVNILGTRNFVATATSDNVFQQMDHGTKTLSVMAMNQPNVFVGTAPGASFWLLRSENFDSENTVEEDYWAEAAEFADSVGADIISSSLGYHHFDDSTANHYYYEQDGHTALISRTASMLADKGIVCVNSAGNDGMGSWKKINFPADAENILTVGAITFQGLNTPFSSVGPTADGRIKPDVMAVGNSTAVVSGSGSIQHNNGTSFSCPTVAGMVACLWQALPNKSAKEIIRLVQMSSNNVEHPDNIYGYGVPDFWRAYTDGLNSSAK